ncbi:MAG: alpha-rhamnosidase, partial [Bacteroidales bacterium]|nr:alpha-rhamnosidase [Bacteroidales bacterium]
RIGKYADTAYFQNEMDFVGNAYNARYLDTITGRYDHNTVTANILPLAFGMVPQGLEDKVFANIIDKTVNDFGGHVPTGVVGIQHLMTTLTNYGRDDLALKLATDTTYPSWGYMVKRGATTIWELWNGDTGDPTMNSGNHVMLLGDLISWCYSYLGGIRGYNGYSHIILKPYPIDGLDYVNCSYNSVSGRIESHWRRIGDRLEWDIVIPANRTAEVWIPEKDGYELLKLTSGCHHLTSRLN